MCSVCDLLQFRDRPKEFAVSPEAIIFVHSCVGEVTTSTTGLGSSQTVPASVFRVRGQGEDHQQQARSTPCVTEDCAGVCVCVSVRVPEVCVEGRTCTTPSGEREHHCDIRPELLRCPPPPPPALLLCPPTLPPPPSRPTTSPGSPSSTHDTSTAIATREDLQTWDLIASPRV